MPTALLFVVDDNRVELELFQECAQAAGFPGEVRTFDSGHATLEALQQAATAQGATPALVLIDIRMPQMDGFELVRRVRQALPAPPEMLLFTSSQHPADRASAAALDVELVVKPAALDGYLEFIRDLASRAHTQ